MKTKHKETYKRPNIHDKKRNKIKKEALVSLRHHHKIKKKQAKLGRKILDGQINRQFLKINAIMALKGKILLENYQ